MQIDKQGDKRRAPRRERQSRIDRKDRRELARVIAQLGNSNAITAAALAREWGF